MADRPPATDTGFRTRALIPLCILIVILLVGGYLTVRHTEIFVDATTHQPERYTELYFSDPTSLPINVPHGSSLPVSFVAHNVEARNMSYDYAVSFITDAGQMLSQKQGIFSLQSSQTKTVLVPMSIPGSYRGRAEIQVTLENLDNQSIHYWVKVI